MKKSAAVERSIYHYSAIIRRR